MYLSLHFYVFIWSICICKVIRINFSFLLSLPSVATFVQWPLGLGVAMGRNRVACGSDSWARGPIKRHSWPSSSFRPPLEMGPSWWGRRRERRNKRFEQTSFWCDVWVFCLVSNLSEFLSWWPTWSQTLEVLIRYLYLSLCWLTTTFEMIAWMIVLVPYILALTAISTTNELGLRTDFRSYKKTRICLTNGWPVAGQLDGWLGPSESTCLS